MSRIVIVGTNLLLRMAENLYRRGEITLDDYNKMANRNMLVLDEHKKNVVILR